MRLVGPMLSECKAMGLFNIRYDAIHVIEERIFAARIFCRINVCGNR
jgi:hypothetical protein